MRPRKARRSANELWSTGPCRYPFTQDLLSIQTCTTQVLCDRALCRVPWEWYHPSHFRCVRWDVLCWRGRTKMKYLYVFYDYSWVISNLVSKKLYKNPKTIAKSIVLLIHASVRFCGECRAICALSSFDDKRLFLPSNQPIATRIDSSHTREPIQFALLRNDALLKKEQVSSQEKGYFWPRNAAEHDPIHVRIASQALDFVDCRLISFIRITKRDIESWKLAVASSRHRGRIVKGSDVWLSSCSPGSFWSRSW